jgi:hypothetical protein
MKQLALPILLAFAITSFGQDGKPGPQRIATEHPAAEYQVVVDPKPRDCDFDTAPMGDKHCDYERVTNAEWEQCGRPQCRLKDVHVSWRKVEIGTLNGQIFAVSEIGILSSPTKAQGYLISCEPPPAELSAAFGEAPTNACDYARTQGLQGYKSIPGCYTLAAQSAFVEVFSWASRHGVRVVPFQVVKNGLFNVSAITGDYIVLVRGVAVSRPCVWLLSRFRLEKNVTVTLFPDRVV